MDDTNHDQGNRLITLTGDIACAFVSNNTVSVSDVPLLISNIHGALVAAAAGAAAAPPEPVYTPAVPVSRSIKPDHLVSLIDGRPYKMLRRHLSIHGLTPDQYRQRYGLRPDYPMVSVNYAETRRQLAKKIGLGTKRNRAGARNGTTG
jgi:predicted transcriptional regulator